MKLPKITFRKNLFLYLILLLATFLRLYKLSSLPISLFGDEIDVGYHAWSLITTGKDYMGNLLPTYIQSLAEWRAPFLMYITAPFVGLLGPTTLAIRLPTALLGVLNIYLIYLLTRYLFKNKSLGLITAFILAITPWHIHYSRAAFESTLLITFLLLGTFTFLKKKYSLSIISFILTFYTYSTANLFTPLIVLSLLLIYRKEYQFKHLFKKSYLIILFLPIAYNLTLGNAAGRFNLISVFKDQELIYDVVNQRTSPWVDQESLSEKLFHNKVTAYTTQVGTNYLSAFSPQFLFLSGDPNFRHSTSRFGELLWVTAPFLVLGVSSLLRNLKKKENKLVLFWILIAPIPSSLTQEGAMHATRLILMLPVLTVIIALGIKEFFTLLKSLSSALIYLAIFILLSLTFVNLSTYWHRYDKHYRFESARHWHYGYEQIFQDFSSHTSDDSRIFINNTYEPSLLKFALFSKYPPKKFQQDFTTDVPEENIVPGFDGFRFGENHYFGKARNLDDLYKLLKPDNFYLAAQGQEVPGDWDWAKEPPTGVKVLSSTQDVLSNPLFYLVTSQKN
jgi:4-amino-4-deoxy-L-arabinose transferase-like glycosyltransferase